MFNVNQASNRGRRLRHSNIWQVASLVQNTKTIKPNKHLPALTSFKLLISWASWQDVSWWFQWGPIYGNGPSWDTNKCESFYSKHLAVHLLFRSWFSQLASCPAFQIRFAPASPKDMLILVIKVPKKSCCIYVYLTYSCAAMQYIGVVRCSTERSESLEKPPTNLPGPCESAAPCTSESAEMQPEKLWHDLWLSHQVRKLDIRYNHR